MIRIIYPEQKPAIKTENRKEYIFCIIRKRWMSITPEEWVRQNFLQYCIHVLQYPASLIAVEKQLLIGEMKKRFDIIVYKNSAPFIIVECKEMKVLLSESTIRRVLNYNSCVQAEYMVVTNGSFCAGFKKEENRFVEINEIPFHKGAYVKNLSPQRLFYRAHPPPSREERAVPVQLFCIH
ncbi:MAG: type I restriction enzyme HsdR N-terminal domain-containing protein [Ferruginibacter sp.]